MMPMEVEYGNAGTEASDPLIMDHKSHSIDRVVLFGGRLNLTKRQMGMLGAIFNGVWGGLNLIPLHYAQRDLGMSGASYLISDAAGSLMVCISIWILLFLYHYPNCGYSVKDAIDALPPFHVRELGLPGLLAGLFYSIGNFCSILAVTYLGQGVGFSFCQGQLLISGLWGVFFGEIQGQETIVKWFSSAGITIIGIIWLSYQHEDASVHRYLQPLWGKQKDGIDLIGGAKGFKVEEHSGDARTEIVCDETTISLAPLYLDSRVATLLHPTILSCDSHS
jgi:hypothetical protein